MAKKAGLSPELLRSAVAALIKKDKFEVQHAEINDAGDGINFAAVSESGQLRVEGTFSDPQQELELESQEPAEN